jgi:ribonuclease HII
LRPEGRNDKPFFFCGSGCKDKMAKKSIEAKKTGVPTRDILYAEAAKYAPRAIQILVELMEKGDADSVRIAAAKTILAKAIPDLKALELTGEKGEPIYVKIIEDKVNKDD